MGASAETLEVSSFSIACASSRVRFCVAPLPVAAPCCEMEPGMIMSRFDPSEAICAATFACAPWPMATVATTAATAMTIPSAARNERSLFFLSARRAVRVAASTFMPRPPAARAAPVADR